MVGTLRFAHHTIPHPTPFAPRGRERLRARARARFIFLVHGGHIKIRSPRGVPVQWWARYTLPTLRYPTVSLVKMVHVG